MYFSWILYSNSSNSYKNLFSRGNKIKNNLCQNSRNFQSFLIETIYPLTYCCFNENVRNPLSVLSQQDCYFFLLQTEHNLSYFYKQTIQIFKNNWIDFVTSSFIQSSPRLIFVAGFMIWHLRGIVIPTRKRSHQIFTYLTPLYGKFRTII